MFTEFFLMTPQDAGRYAAQVLGFFSPEEETVCTEIGDGNINYVFQVRSPKSGRSLIIKQSDRLLRSSGRPLDPRRGRIEAEYLRLAAELAPGFVPEVYRYDETMSALSMEDVSAYKNLRREMMAGRIYPHLAEQLPEFLARTLLPTTDLVLDRAEKKRRAAFFVNPELCDITEDLVLTEPYWDYKGRNVITPGNEAFVEEVLYRDPDLHAQVGLLRNAFMNNAQALLHGDLHAGSIFANEHGVRIIDPEFAFYGPMGYDIGNVIASFFFAWAYHAFVLRGAAEADALAQTVRDLFRRTGEQLAAVYDARVTFPLYRTEAFRRTYLEGIRADALGFAGTELIRRVVGDSKVAEVAEVSDLSLRVPMERALIRLGVLLIKERGRIRDEDALVRAFRTILKETEV